MTVWVVSPRGLCRWPAGWSCALLAELGRGDKVAAVEESVLAKRTHGTRKVKAEKGKARIAYPLVRQVSQVLRVCRCALTMNLAGRDRFTPWVAGRARTDFEEF